MIENKNALIDIINKEKPDISDRAIIAKYLKSIGGCPHLNTWHNPGYADSKMKCLDCGEEDV